MSRERPSDNGAAKETNELTSCHGTSLFIVGHAWLVKNTSSRLRTASIASMITAGICARWNGVRRSLCAAANVGRRCRSWVIHVVVRNDEVRLTPIAEAWPRNLVPLNRVPSATKRPCTCLILLGHTTLRGPLHGHLRVTVQCVPTSSFRSPSACAGRCGCAAR